MNAAAQNFSKTCREARDRFLQAARAAGGRVNHHEHPLRGPETSETYKRMRRWWGTRVRTTVSEDSISSNVPGSITVCLAEELQGREVTPLGLEFGTVPIAEVTMALQADNWLHQNGGRGNPKAKEIAKTIRDAFYIDADDWKEKVTAQTRDVCRAALKGLHE